MAIYGNYENLYSKDSLDWFVKQLKLKNYDELKSFLSLPEYWSMFQLHRYSIGEISKDELHNILSDSGFTYRNGKYVHDNRSKFGVWVMDKFGPTFAKVCASLFGGAVLSDVLDGSSDFSSVSDTTPAIYGGSGFNPQTVIGSGQSLSPDNSFSWLSNLFGNLFGEKGTFSSMLTGLGSQFASSLLNKQNMIDLIDYQNQYNTPSAQMQRFKDAGLNPNLVYGLGSNGNQPSAGSIAPVDFDTSQRENRMAMMQFDLASKQAQADIAQKMSAVQLNNANASEVEERRIAQANQNSIFDMQVQIVGAQLDKSIADATLALNEASGWKEKRQAELNLLFAQKRKAEFDSTVHSKVFGTVEDVNNFVGKHGEELKDEFPWLTGYTSIGEDFLKSHGVKSLPELMDKHFPNRKRFRDSRLGSKMSWWN